MLCIRCRVRLRATLPHSATFPQNTLIEPTHRGAIGTLVAGGNGKGAEHTLDPSPPQALLRVAEQSPARVRIYLQVAPPGWPCARPAGVSVPVPIEQVAPAAFACVAVPAQPVAEPANVSETPDEPVGAV